VIPMAAPSCTATDTPERYASRSFGSADILDPPD
jgi:hypothetical protein